MAQLTLSGWFTLELFQVLLVFVRVGAAMMLLPGFGEPAVPVRIRVLTGLAIGAALTPTIAGLPDAVPNAAGVLVGTLAEALNGLLLGALCRTLISAVTTAGQIISMNIGMTNIFAAGVSMDQSATIGAVIYAGVIAILFASGGHHMMLRGLAESYDLLPVGQFPNAAITANVVVAAGAKALRLATQISLPFLLLALLFNSALAVINRALPAIPLFMLANPVLVVLGLYLLASTMPGILDPGLADWPDIMGLLH